MRQINSPDFGTEAILHFTNFQGTHQKLSEQNEFPKQEAGTKRYFTRSRHLRHGGGNLGQTRSPHGI